MATNKPATKPVVAPTKPVATTTKPVVAPVVAPATALVVPTKGNVAVTVGQAITVQGVTVTAPFKGLATAHSANSAWPQVACCQNGHPASKGATTPPTGHFIMVATGGVVFATYCSTCAAWHLWPYVGQRWLVTKG